MMKALSSLRPGGAKSPTSTEALSAMRADPDIAAEARELGDVQKKTQSSGTRQQGSWRSAGEDSTHPTARARDTATEHPLEERDRVALNVVRFSHTANAETRRLCESVGGLAKLREFTGKFYEKAFADPHIDKFIREHDDHHGERFAAWIAEKMGVGRPWTEERASREVCPFHSRGYELQSAFDRSSAHFAAWHSPKREPEKFGEHFKLDDCRIWMRLHFWAARETGVLDTAFGDYYVRFIGHFVSVYERTAPSFARESARWSADPANIKAYFDAGRAMPDVLDLSLSDALRQLPPSERDYTGSGAQHKLWPYEL